MPNTTNKPNHIRNKKNPATGITGSGTSTGTNTGDQTFTLTVPNIFLAGSPSMSTLSFTVQPESANLVWAGPTSGGSATPTFRTLVAADIPSLSGLYQPLDSDLTAIAALVTTSYGRGLLTSASATALMNSLSASDLTTGTLPDARLSNTISASSLGDASHSLSVTYDAHGRLTAASSNLISIAWSQITSGVPTTLSGYGITDAQPLDSDLTAIAALTTTSYGRGLLTSVSATTLMNSLSASDLTTGTLPAGRLPALTGDIITSIGTVATTLATVNSNTGSWGSATQSPVFTVNGKGLITAVTNTTITPAFSSLTGKPTTAVGYGITGGASLDSLAGASTTSKLYYLSAASTWSAVTIGSGVTFSGGTLSATGSGGSVTSVGLTSTDFTVSGSPVTTSGNITANLVTQAGITAASYGDAAHSLSATVNSKGVLTALSTNPIAIGWSAITSGTPATLTNFIALSWTAGTQVPVLTAANTWSLKIVGTASGNLLDKASGDTLYLGLTATAADSSKLGGTVAASYALLASPTFTGTPAAPNASPGTNTTQIATTAFVATSYAPLASPTFTGTPAGPTAVLGTNTTQIATTAFVQSATSPLAPLASPALTGTPTTPTAALLTNTTQIASTAFVQAALGGYLTTTTAASTYQPLDGDLTSIAGNTTGGFLTRTASNTYTPRTITAGTGTTVTNGDGVSGVPTIAVNYGTTSTTAAVGNDSRITGSVQGAQTGTLTTTDATTTTLMNVVTSTGTANTVDALILARNTSTGDSAAWQVAGLWNNAAGTASAVGTPTVTLIAASAGASTWLASVTVATNNIRFRATGQAATTIHWSFDGRLVSVA